MSKSFVTLILVLTAALISVNASSLPAKAFQNATIKFVTSDEIKDLLKANPNLVELNRKVHKEEIQGTKESVAAPRLTINYYLGQRTPYDFLVAHDAQSHSWSQPLNVQLTVKYPTAGTGRIVTYVDIFVQQSSNAGRAYVTSGGIGLRWITIVVEAYSTYYFDHDARIFGQN